MVEILIIITFVATVAILVLAVMARNENKELARLRKENMKLTCAFDTCFGMLYNITNAAFKVKAPVGLMRLADTIKTANLHLRLDQELIARRKRYDILHTGLTIIGILGFLLWGCTYVLKIAALQILK